MFTASLRQCNQYRYCIAFPISCADWLQAYHPICPEEVSPLYLQLILLYNSSLPFAFFSLPAFILTCFNIFPLRLHVFPVVIYPSVYAFSVLTLKPALQKNVLAMNSIQMAKSFIDRLVKQTVAMIFAMCKEHCKLAQQVCGVSE